MNLSDAPTRCRHLDDLAVARHRAAGGEPDRRSHRQDHEREEGGGKDDNGVGHRADARRPDAMVVEIGLRDRRRQRGSQRGEILRPLAPPSRTTMSRGIGSWLRSSPLPNQGSSSRSDSAFE